VPLRHATCDAVGDGREREVAAFYKSGESKRVRRESVLLNWGENSMLSIVGARFGAMWVAARGLLMWVNKCAVGLTNRSSLLPINGFNSYEF
jgi:hypothetical protein